MSGLVLSLFPGIGMLDLAFEQEGFTVVRGPDVIWGGDVRRFHPPAGKFDGIIGGDPCQSHSSLANLVRAKGLEPSFPDLGPEYQRVVEEARPAWFLRENVPGAPDIKPLGYEVTSFLLDNCWLGEAQMRKRRFWFGWDRVRPAPNLRRWIPGAALELPSSVATVTQRADSARGDVLEKKHDRLKMKVTAVGGHDGTTLRPKGTQQIDGRLVAKTPPVTGRHEGAVGAPGKDYSPPRRDLPEMLELQGFPTDWLEHQPWTMQAKRKMVGNGVPLPMGRAVAKAVFEAIA